MNRVLIKMKNQGFTKQFTKTGDDMYSQSIILDDGSVTIPSHEKLEYYDMMEIIKEHDDKNCEIAVDCDLNSEPEQKCLDCSGTQFYEAQGFPGETMTVCLKCNAVLEAYFNINDVI